MLSSGIEREEQGVRWDGCGHSGIKKIFYSLMRKEDQFEQLPWSAPSCLDECFLDSRGAYKSGQGYRQAY